MFNSKTDFRKNLQGVESAFLSGNEYWFTSDEDINLYVTFSWKGHKYLFIEYVGYTNGGAAWSQVLVFQYGTDNIVYEDYDHDGNGAWQTGDSHDGEVYSELTEYMVKVFRSYVE